MDNGKGFRFTLEEFSGAFGDTITVLPLIIGIGLTTEASLAHLLLFFGIFEIATGLYFRLPVPVEPMKALATLAIAGTLSYSGIVGAGLVLGVLLIFSGRIGIMEKMDRVVPKTVIRGIQLGLAFILLQSALEYSLQGPWLALIGILIVICFFLLNWKFKVPNISAFIVIFLGVSYGIYVFGAPPISLMEIPSINLPTLSEMPDAIVEGAIPQFLLSVGNAILATSLLFQDLLGEKVNPDKLSQSMGVMCIFSSLFGGFPMCHGSGGLAGKYRFGARTAGSNIILGSFYLIIAIMAGSPHFLDFFPIAVLGSLLVFVSLELGLASKNTTNWKITVITGGVAFLTNIAIGFLVGFILAKTIKKIMKK